MSTPGRKPRGRALLPFLVTMVLLAAVGATGGWLYGERVADRRSANRGGGVVTQPTTPPAAEEPQGDPCPEATESAAEDAGSPGGLVEIFYIRTEDNKQVWICRDTAGSIFYQGYVGAVGGDFRQGENALFLTTVAESGAGYLATNQTDDGTTIYSVTAYRLTQSTNGKESTFPVAERRP